MPRCTLKLLSVLLVACVEAQRATVPTLLPSVRSLQRLGGGDVDVSVVNVVAVLGSEPHVVAQATRFGAELGPTPATFGTGSLLI